MTSRIIIPCILLSIVIALVPVGTADSGESRVDLAFTSLASAPAGAPGSPLYGWFRMENNGDQISMTETVTLYLSVDPNITPDDYPIGTTEVAFLRPGASVEKGIIGTVPDRISPGTYFTGARTEGKFRLLKDAREEDNVITGGTITIDRSFTRPQEWYNERISDLVTRYSNDERELRNLGPLSRDGALDIIAREMSEDMAERKFFDHINPDGEDPVDRAGRHGYPQLRYLPGGEEFAGISENIVKIPIGDVFRFGEINPDDPDQIARIAVRSFMDSPSHKATLLLPEFEVIGLGCAFDGTDYYITQNFF